MAGRSESAFDLARRALNLAEERQERGLRAHVQYLLGDIAASAGDSSLQAAETAYREALVLAEPLAMRPLVAQCHRGLAGLSGRARRLDEAREQLAEAIAMFREMDMRSSLARAEADLKRLG